MRISDWSSDVCSSDLLLDWDGVSEALVGIAQRLGADAGQRHQSWPSPAETLRMAETAAALPGGVRAVRFGFQTLLEHQRYLWHLVKYVGKAQCLDRVCP